MTQAERRVKLLIVSSCDSLASVVCNSVFLNPNIQVVCIAKTRLSLIKKFQLLSRAMKAGSVKYAIYMQLEILIAYLRGLRKTSEKAILNYASERGIPLSVVDALTRDTTIHLLEAFKPDMILSVRPGLIFKRTAIDSMPPIINLHCSRLPKHAGIGGVLQALAANDAELGVTFHFVDSEEIDSGAIVMQGLIPVENGKSVFHHTYVLYQKAASMISLWEPSYDSGDLAFHRCQVDCSLEQSYNSWPGKSVYRRLAKNGYSLISLRNIFDRW